MDKKYLKVGLVGRHTVKDIATDVFAPHIRPQQVRAFVLSQQ